jgi:hypothetical protein
VREALENFRPPFSKGGEGEYNASVIPLNNYIKPVRMRLP